MSNSNVYVVGDYNSNPILANIIYTAGTGIDITSNVISTKPYIQYGTYTGSGNIGNSIITLATPYSNTNYNVSITHLGTSPGTNYSVNILTSSTFHLYWNNNGSGSAPFSYITVGN
jgi:hypothetical protein